MSDFQQVNQPQQLDMNTVLHLEKWGMQRFHIQNSSMLFHYKTVLDVESYNRYILVWVNGSRNDDFFTQVAVLQNREGKMFFLNYPVEKDATGWRIMNA